MLLKEQDKINQLLNGTLSAEEMYQFSKQIEIINDKSKKLGQNEKFEQFDANKAWEKLNSRIENNTSSEKREINIISPLRIAASIILIIGISIFGYFMINDFGSLKYSKVNSGNKIKELILPDGSLVSLNYDSSIKFPKEFSEEKRFVEFSGEAFFNIKKNHKKPFIIKSDNSEITVIGTSFNVETNNKNISVTVKTGKVKLAKNKKEHVFIVAGELGKISNNTLSKNKNTNKNYLSWKTKCFKYNGEKLSKVILDFNKVYKVNIVLDTTVVEDLPIVSSIKNKSIDLALNIVCTTNNLKYIKKEKKIIISKK